MVELLDINKFERLYRRTKGVKGVSGSVVYIKLSPVGPGKIRVLTHVTVEDKTTAYTKVRVGIDHGGILYYLDELGSPAADELAVARSDVLLGEGDRFFAELAGTTTADELVMTCCGWEQSL